MEYVGRKRTSTVNPPSDRHKGGNPFAEPAVAHRYEQWYATAGLRADLLEKDLLGKLLDSFPSARTAIEVGCGTGHFTRWMTERRLDAVGVDISRPMLDEARRLGGPRYFAGDALSLPVADRSFDLAAMITTLEFVSDPAAALAEAVRVARLGIVLGVLNRSSLLALRHRLSRKLLWRCARFFGPGELTGMCRAAAGRRAGNVVWRTTLWPIPGVRELPLPWGGFIGMAVHLNEEHEP